MKKMKMVLQQRGARLAEDRSEEMPNGEGVAASIATHKSSFMKKRGIIKQVTDLDERDK